MAESATVNTPDVSCCVSYSAHCHEPQRQQLEFPPSVQSLSSCKSSAGRQAHSDAIRRDNTGRKSCHPQHTGLHPAWQVSHYKSSTPCGQCHICCGKHPHPHATTLQSDGATQMQLKAAAASPCVPPSHLTPVQQEAHELRVPKHGCPQTPDISLLAQDTSP